MQPSKFWGFVNSGQFGSVSDCWPRIWDDEEARTEAIRMLLSECPSAEAWVAYEPHYRHHNPSLFYDLVLNLAGGSSDNESPKPMMYDPANFTFHYDAEKFRQMLLQRPVRGSVNAIYEVMEGSAFWQPGSNERFVTVARQHFWRDDDDVHCWSDLDGAAILLICGDKVDVYPFPQNWGEVLDSVRDELDHMTAREKATVELPVVLKSFVDLLDWGLVMDALEALRPRDD